MNRSLHIQIGNSLLLHITNFAFICKLLLLLIKNVNSFVSNDTYIFILRGIHTTIIGHNYESNEKILILSKLFISRDISQIDL